MTIFNTTMKLIPSNAVSSSKNNSKWLDYFATQHYWRIGSVEDPDSLTDFDIIKIKQNDVRVFLNPSCVTKFTNYCHLLDKLGVSCRNYAVVGNSAKQRHRNLNAMENIGYSPTPTLVYGDPLTYVSDYVRNHEALIVDISRETEIKPTQLKNWLDHLWATLLVDVHGRPRVDVIAIGLPFELIGDYPWFAVDDSRWKEQKTVRMFNLIPKVTKFITYERLD